jgi:hypothetical protein
MTLQEMKAAGRKAAEIEAALSVLVLARIKLAAVNRHVKSGQVWSPKFLIKEGRPYHNDEVAVQLTVPAEYLQQWAVDEVRSAERAVIAAGGSVPTMAPNKAARP